MVGFEWYIPIFENLIEKYLYWLLQKFESKENSNFGRTFQDTQFSWRISASSLRIESRWESALLEMSLVRRVRQKSQKLGVESSPSSRGRRGGGGGRNKMKAVEGDGLRDEGGVGEDGEVEKESRREQSGTK